MLNRARLAFDQGDYVTVRNSLRSLLAEGASGDVKKDAEELLARLGVDRIALLLALVCVVFFAVVVLAYLA